MKLQEIKKIAQGKGIRIEKGMEKADIVKAIQRHEGNIDCYGMGRANDCGEMSCLWRQDCLK